MTRLLLLFSLSLLLSTGCMFAKKKPKENASIPGEVQETFRKRWVDKRAAELVAKGTAAEAAHTQADTEFRAAYDFSAPGSKK